MRFDKLILGIIGVLVISALSYALFLCGSLNIFEGDLKPARGKLMYAFVIPHPPMIVPDVGNIKILKAVKTSIAVSYIAKQIARERPDTVIIVTPHSIMHPTKFNIYRGYDIKGDLSNFGAKDLQLDLINDEEFIQKLKKNIKAKKVELNDLISSIRLDHGSFIPAYFLSKAGYKGKYVIINYSNLSRNKHIEFGKAIRKTIEQSKGKYVFIASGDMSHRLFQDSKNGYSLQGKDFDAQIVKNLEIGNYRDIVEMNLLLVNEAGQCGYNSLLVGLGVVNMMPINNKIFSYEAPFGVGYVVGSL
jgi:aromatic ring-opening dioxygenase LigB subunit